MDFNGSVTVCTTGWGCGDVSKDGKYVKACKKNFNIPTKYVLLKFLVLHRACLSVVCT